MSMSDPIADMLTRIRNAQVRHKGRVQMGATRLKVAVAQVLKEEGYIKDCKIDRDELGKRCLVVDLKYYNGEPVITQIKRVSKPGLRVYCGCEKLPQVMGGMGLAIVSTSKGVVSDRKARSLGEGGEVICFVN